MPNRPPKQHFIRREELERDSVRVVQMNAAQDMLFSMSESGERVAGFQMEIDGVVQSLVVRRCTQQEFVEVMKAAADAETRGARPASPTP